MDNTIGERIKKKREELGLTQEELAKKLGYKSRSSINKLEMSRELSLKNVRKMAKALECSESYLMGWDFSDNAADKAIEIIKRKDLAKQDAKLHELMAGKPMMRICDVMLDLNEEQRDAVATFVETMTKFNK